MTANQIAFWNLEENRRHNVASEEIGATQAAAAKSQASAAHRQATNAANKITMDRANAILAAETNRYATDVGRGNAWINAGSNALGTAGRIVAAGLS